MVLSEDIKRKLHYAAFNVGVLKSIKSFLNDEATVKVMDECIEINEKLGDGYKLCKVDDIRENANKKIHEYIERTGGCSIVTMQDNYDECIWEACNVCNTEHKDR